MLLQKLTGPPPRLPSVGGPLGPGCIRALWKGHCLPDAGKRGHPTLWHRLGSGAALAAEAPGRWGPWEQPLKAADLRS